MVGLFRFSSHLVSVSSGCDRKRHSWKRSEAKTFSSARIPKPFLCSGRSQGRHSECYDLLERAGVFDLQGGGGGGGQHQLCAHWRVSSELITHRAKGPSIIPDAL